jgi:hypothetical protein
MAFTCQRLVPRLRHKTQKARIARLDIGLKHLLHLGGKAGHHIGLPGQRAARRLP